MKNLYRRYRPLRLSEVVGQDQVVEPLGRSLAQGKVGHAYLFVGPRGCGKTSVARILAHEINGFKYEVEDNYVDIIEIDGASNRGIDNIRELREKVLVAPTSGKYKVYIIDEVHMLTKEAFNALLKTLEEPPEHVVFIMATTDAIKVPVTITSRAQTYTFKLATYETMFNFLKSVAEKESIKITDEALSVIAKRGGGSFRDSLSLLDQISTLSENQISKEMVVSAMGLPEDEKIADLLASYLSGDVAKITTLLKDLLSSGIKPETLAEELISEILDNPKPELLVLLSKLPDVKAPFPEAKLLVCLTSRVRVADNVFSRNISRFSSPETYIPDGPDRFAREAGGSAGVPAYDVEGEKVRSGKDMSDRTRTQTVPAKDFDWDGFLDRVQEKNDAVYMQLKRVTYIFSGDALEIYPEKRIARTILMRDNNKRILIDAAGGVKITIHEVGDTPVNAVKDETLTKISDIMGGEVTNDAGGNPF